MAADPTPGVVEMAVAVIEAAEFETVQALFKSAARLTTLRIISGPTLLTGICFCAGGGMTMTLRTGKGGRYAMLTTCAFGGQRFGKEPAARQCSLMCSTPKHSLKARPQVWSKPAVPYSLQESQI